jgi:hypothetical protein
MNSPLEGREVHLRGLSGTGECHATGAAPSFSPLPRSCGRGAGGEGSPGEASRGLRGFPPSLRRRGDFSRSGPASHRISPIVHGLGCIPSPTQFVGEGGEERAG